jgi:tRNA pseudouridine55 synthase
VPEAIVTRQVDLLDGLLVVDKPGLDRPLGAGNPPPHDLLTSHDVVQIVRRLTGQQRIGHAGTLDPLASGILVLCLGRATRLAEYYQAHRKRYLAGMRLGAATDTYDALGRVVSQAPVPKLSTAQLTEALKPLRGDIVQIPPIYSALKQGGESLHRRARRGEQVTVRPRRITVHHLDLVDWTRADRIFLEVECSSGTYVRSLVHDLGRAIGTYAYLDYLRRETSGPFTLAHACPLASIEAKGDRHSIAEHLLQAGDGLDMPVMSLDSETIRRLGYGQHVRLPVPVPELAGNAHGLTEAPNLPYGKLLARGYDEGGEFVGILRLVEDAAPIPDGESVWKAEKWFVSAEREL